MRLESEPKQSDKQSRTFLIPHPLFYSFSSCLSLPFILPIYFPSVVPLFVYFSLPCSPCFSFSAFTFLLPFISSLSFFTSFSFPVLHHIPLCFSFFSCLHPFISSLLFLSSFSSFSFYSHCLPSTYLFLLSFPYLSFFSIIFFILFCLRSLSFFSFPFFYIPVSISTFLLLMFIFFYLSLSKLLRPSFFSFSSHILLQNLCIIFLISHLTLEPLYYLPYLTS